MSGENDNEAQRLAKLQSDLDVAREASIDLAASLAAALSILQRAHKEGKQPRLVAPSDKMFAMMMMDYQKSLDRARTTLANIEKES